MERYLKKPYLTCGIDYNFFYKKATHINNQIFKKYIHQFIYVFIKFL